MIEARSGHTAALLADGKVLVAGGISNGPDPLASAELYDPSTGSWTATGDMIEARWNHTATLLRDGKVLVAGGGYGGVRSAELYDPSSGSWTATGNMHEGRRDHTATLLRDGKVLVAGGYASSGGSSEFPGPVASAELYDPGTGFWTATGNMAEARGSHTATLLPNGTVLVVGDLASAEVYDPGTGSWTATGNMAEARGIHTATLLPNGTVLVVGGNSGTKHLASAELYHPDTGLWTATASMAEGRNGHTATLLPDGTVLVAGSLPNPYSRDALASAELYDPGSGTWAETGSMIKGRCCPPATLLLDGTVLVAGGEGSSGPLCDGCVVVQQLASAELYAPSGGS